MQTSFWTDAQWIHLWRPHPLDFAIQQASLREPWSLLRTRLLRRHEKAVDARTGETVGYARWILPDVEGAEEWWGGAQVEDMEPEEQEVAKRDFESAEWPPFGRPRPAIG